MSGPLDAARDLRHHQVSGRQVVTYGIIVTIARMEPRLPFDDRTEPPTPRTAGSSFPWSSLIWGVVALVAFLIFLIALPGVVDRVTHAVHAGPERAAAEAAREALETVDMRKLSEGFGLVVKAVGPSVVHISTRQRFGRANSDEFSELFGTPRRETLGQGSGVIVDAAGYIVTNYHVVRSARDVRVRLSTGREVAAEVIGTDALTDLAVLKVSADGLVAATWGDSDALDVGSFVWALGSPFGLDHSVTFGIVSNKARPGIASAFQSFLQTDAAVNPGNSGGPLVNVRGEVVGINTAIVGPSYQGVSFALPSNTAKQVFEQLRGSGSIDRGWLGVEMREITSDIAKDHRLEETTGVLVHSVIPDSPADHAKIQPGDVLLEWNATPVRNPIELSRLVAQTPIDSNANAVVSRGKQKVTLEVRVGKRPPQLSR
jgi:serine protease Do